MGVETPPKYVNREMNSQIGIRGQNSHIELSDGAPPTSMLLWGAAHSVTRIYVMHMTSVHISNQGDEKIVPPSHSPPLATSTKKQKKKEEGYNKLDKLWSTTDNKKQAVTIKCKFSFDKAF
jgi:hypothetical protein